jgi:hypothetical protein
MTTPAGWYTDPQDAQKIRYFDGKDWTSQSIPRPVSGVQGQPGPAPLNVGNPYAGSGQTVAGQATAGQPFVGQATPGGGWMGQSQPQPQPVSPTAGYAFAGRQQIPVADTPRSQSSRSVWIIILAALVGIVVIVGAGVALSDKEDATGLSADSLGLPSTFGCTELFDSYIETLPDDTATEDPATIIDSVGVLTEVENNIGSVTQPNEGSVKENLIMACEGTGTWKDGSTSDVRLELTIDGDGQVWVGGVEN